MQCIHLNVRKNSEFKKCLPGPFIVISLGFEFTIFCWSRKPQIVLPGGFRNAGLKYVRQESFFHVSKETRDPPDVLRLFLYIVCMVLFRKGS